MKLIRDGERGCRSEGAQRGREERFYELTGMWQKEKKLLVKTSIFRLV